MTLKQQFLCLSFPAQAEWLWDDPEYLKGQFESFVRNEIQNQCDDYSVNNLSFGYQDAYPVDEENPTIAYQIVVLGSTLSCWENLQREIVRSFEEDEVLIGIKQPNKVSFFPDVVTGKNPIADSGPSIVFYFPVTKDEITLIQ